MVAAAAGCRCAIALPDDAAAEKAQLLACLGASVRRVRPVSITHPDHFVNVARRVRALKLLNLRNGNLLSPHALSAFFSLLGLLLPLYDRAMAGLLMPFFWEAPFPRQARGCSMQKALG